MKFKTLVLVVVLVAVLVLWATSRRNIEEWTKFYDDYSKNISDIAQEHGIDSDTAKQRCDEMGDVCRGFVFVPNGPKDTGIAYFKGLAMDMNRVSDAAFPGTVTYCKNCDSPKLVKEPRTVTIQTRTLRKNIGDRQTTTPVPTTPMSVDIPRDGDPGWEDLKRHFNWPPGLGVFGDINPASWRAVRNEQDGLRYWIHKDQTDPDYVLNLMGQCNAQMEQLGEVFRRRLTAADPRVQKMDAWLQKRKDFGCVLTLVRPTPFPPGIGAVAYGDWIIMGPGWTFQECPTGGQKTCVGSVIHELAHVICADHEGHNCHGHGSGWCRTNAELLLDAHAIGMWTPNPAVGNYNPALFSKLPAMKHAPFFHDNGCEVAYF